MFGAKHCRVGSQSQKKLQKPVALALRAGEETYGSAVTCSSVAIIDPQKLATASIPGVVALVVSLIIIRRVQGQKDSRLAGGKLLHVPEFSADGS
jgi:hypothetical protein